jgi:hypothetical protein
MALRPAVVLPLALFLSSGCASHLGVTPAPGVADQGEGDVVSAEATDRYGGLTIDFRSYRLQTIYDQLMQHSPYFRDAVASIRDESVVRIHLRLGYAEDFPALERPDRSLIGAAMMPRDGRHPRWQERMDTLDIVFGTRSMEEAAFRAGLPDDTIRIEMAAILAHEIAGHLVPLVLVGKGRWPTTCADPLPFDPVSLGCAVDVENRVRHELGLPLRERYQHVNLRFVCLSMPDLCDGPASEDGLPHDQDLSFRPAILWQRSVEPLYSP